MFENRSDFLCHLLGSWTWFCIVRFDVKGFSKMRDFSWSQQESLCKNLYTIRYSTIHSGVFSLVREEAPLFLETQRWNPVIPVSSWRLWALYFLLTVTFLWQDYSTIVDIVFYRYTYLRWANHKKRNAA